MCDIYTYNDILSQDKNISNMKVQIEEWYRTSKNIQDIGFKEINVGDNTIRDYIILI